ncbi:hypothetical protein NX059_005704 [Plenodomus lindquistii]|nr:hypothetical protein NX059_005704 [Plenodomus lindquistii]
MTPRKSGRAKAAVKYHSGSEGSDFSAQRGRKGKKPRKGGKKEKSSLESRMTKKRSAPDAEDTTPTNTTTAAAASSSKRQKKEPKSTTAGKDTTNMPFQRIKLSPYQSVWGAWVSSHSVEGALLDAEPDKEVAITQSNVLKKYGLRKEELTSLKHFEKKNPLYGGVMRLYLEEELKVLVFRKLGILDGVAVDKEGEVLRRGEELWKEKDEQGKSGEPAAAAAAAAAEAKGDNGKEAKIAEELEKVRMGKELWAVYLAQHTLEYAASLPEEPEKDKAINQTAAKEQHGLNPEDLAVLPYFPKKNNLYKNVSKIFVAADVSDLALRKRAVMAGSEGDDRELLIRGRELKLIEMLRAHQAQKK